MKIFDTMPAQAELQRLLASGELDAFGLNRQSGEEALPPSIRVTHADGIYLDVAVVCREEGDKESAAAINTLLTSCETRVPSRASLDRAKARWRRRAPRRAR